jgi:hypothetical protein
LCCKVIRRAVNGTGSRGITVFPLVAASGYDLFMASKPPPAPRGLDTVGRGLWRAAVAEFAFSSVELAQLRQVAKTADEIGAMETELATMEMIVGGSRNQPKVNPLIRELRDHRKLFDQLVAGLALPIGDETAGRRRSAAARRTVNTPRIKLAPTVAALQRQRDRDSRGA